MKILDKFRTSIMILGYLSIFSLATAQAHANKIRILAYGDSLTAGHQITPSLSYPKQLEKLLVDSGQSVEIINAGISGNTSQEALDRMDWNLKQGPFNWVFLCIGANDGLRNLPVQQMERNITQMILNFKKTGSKILLMGMEVPTNQNPKYRKEFKETFAKIAREQKVLFYPFFLKDVALKPQYNLADQIHPNEKGYALNAHNLFVFMKDRLKN